MLAIKNMEMPKGCRHCMYFRKHLFCNGMDYSYSCILGATEFPMPWIRQMEERASDCPLVEIVTCNDCKHWDKDITPRVPDTKEYHFCPMMDCNTSEDFYCKDGERRK